MCPPVLILANRLKESNDKVRQLIDGGCTASYWYGDLQYLKATH